MSDHVTFQISVHPKLCRYHLLHSFIRGILTQSCSAGARNFTKCVFYDVQFSSGVIQNIAYHHRAIFILFVYVDYYQNNQFYLVKISFSKFCFYGTMIGNILDNTTELYMLKYTFGEIFSSGGATLYKNPSDQTVTLLLSLGKN